MFQFNKTYATKAGTAALIKTSANGLLFRHYDRTAGPPVEFRHDFAGIAIGGSPYRPYDIIGPMEDLNWKIVNPGVVSVTPEDAAAIEELKQHVGQYASFDSLSQVVKWIKDNHDTHYLSNLIDLQRQVRDAYIAADLPRHVSQGFVLRSPTAKEQVELLKEAAIKGAAAQRTLARIHAITEGTR